MGAFDLSGFNTNWASQSWAPTMTIPDSAGGTPSMGSLGTGGIGSWGVNGGDASTPSLVRGASDPMGAAVQNLGTENANPMGSPATTATPGGVTAPGVTSPNAAGGVIKPGDIDGGGLGLNIGTGRLLLGGIQTVGNLWAAWQANKLANEQFKYQKNVTEQNLANQMETYNTQLEDRARSRAYTEQGQAGATDANAYVAQHRLQRRG